VLRQDGQILFCGKGWIFEPGADLADDLAEQTGREIELIGQEVVGVLGLEPVRSEGFRGENRGDSA
jgi:hypothetical protein